MKNPPIYVTRPILPPIEDAWPILKEIWETRILTNGGPILNRLEKALSDYLGVEHISLVNNASIGLVMALRHFGITGEVITTPFSFVATGHAIRWAGAEPVFADIDPVSLNIDPEKVERQITPRTQAILAVHCYGAPCDTAALADIAKRHGIRLIYDAAHAFGVRQAGVPLVGEGDLSVLSFHATKVFNTLEGGAIIAPDRATKEALDRLGNYGIVNELTIEATGLNSKMNEMNAAMGLALLPHIDLAIAARKRVAQRYWDALHEVAGLRCVSTMHNDGHNYYAFPILVGDGYPLTRDGLYTRLREDGIFSRRYFFPLISDFPMYRDLASAQPGNLPVAGRAGEQILCLPIYPDLAESDQDRIIEAVLTPNRG